MSKTVAIIGAGASGIAACKACIEDDLCPIVYEKTNYLGGLWQYHEEDVHGVASIYKSTVINSSKELSAFSDFVPEDRLPNFMHNKQMVNYLHSYAQSFQFNKYVKFNHEIIKIEKDDDYETNSKWKVTVKDLVSQAIHVKVYDAVMICAGIYVYPNIPDMATNSKFTGQVMHSHSYKYGQEFANKNVVVIGIGNSGLDIATELSKIANQVYLSTRRGAWILKKSSFQGVPADHLFLRRCLSFLLWLIPFNLYNWMMERIISVDLNHDLYGLRPKHRFLAQHPTLSDALPECLITGRVVLRKDIDHLTENGVVFKGCRMEVKCDVIIFCTGYKTEFPFVSDSLWKDSAKNKPKLYKNMFSPELSHPETLGFIGLVLPFGPVFPLFELQSRWFTALNTGKVKLPNKEEMLDEMSGKGEAKHYYESERNTLEVEWQNYQDDLAERIGVKPNLLYYFFTDFKLWWRLFFGPNSWSGARDAIFNVWKRIETPLKVA